VIGALRMRRSTPVEPTLPGRRSAESACDDATLQLEGVVSKRLDAPYRGGRSDTWAKTKCRPSQELVIGGWRQAPGGPFEGLLVGVYDQGRLRYAGRLKSGFGRSAGLLSRLQALEVDQSPFQAGDTPRPSSSLHWVRPDLVASADIAEWTASGALRQAAFKGLREDKDPKSVMREFPNG
jgi:bifunctional non-homologous end joining protein LigD